MPYTGFQAVILCGPGVSLDIFTSNPKDFPKALVPIANRPMVWYPLEWCYRMGITDILLITPPESAAALEAGLSQNPHLTSLPAPKPNLLAPETLTLTTGTGEIFRLPEVRAAITGDFVIIPCDLVCELGGDALLESWMVQQGGFGDAASGKLEGQTLTLGVGGERGGRRGGLGVWYDTTGEGSVKGEETDFIITTPLPAPLVPPSPGSLGSSISKLVYAVPTDTLNDITEEKQGLPLRHSLLKKTGRIKLHTTKRDAHIYFFPYWTLEMIRRNEKLDSISEDVVGWWAKAGWQDGLGEKLGLRDVLYGSIADSEVDAGMTAKEPPEEELDLSSMSTTWTSQARAGNASPSQQNDSSLFASRVRGPSGEDKSVSDGNQYILQPLKVPPVLAYVHPASTTSPLIRRVDTIDLLLAMSLRLARLPSLEEIGSKAPASPFAHPAKVAYAAGVAQKSTVTRVDCLLAENVTVNEKTVIKESVIGANCEIGNGARLTRCLLMEGAAVEEGCVLSGCVLGRRSRIGKKSELKDCRVQDAFVVPEQTDEKGQNFTAFESLSDEGDEEYDSAGGDADLDDASGVLDDTDFSPT